MKKKMKTKKKMKKTMPKARSAAYNEGFATAAHMFGGRATSPKRVLNSRKRR